MHLNGVKSLLLLGAREVDPLLRLMVAVTRAKRSEPIAAAQWDAEYRDGQWDFLGDLREAAHYQVITSYYERLTPSGAVLDVGCGEGRLNEVLRRAGYASYVGIDISAVALARASFHADEHTQFLVADAESFDTTDRFDVIVVNEALYYFQDPARTTRCLARLLRPGGVIILSVALCGLKDGLNKLAMLCSVERDFRLRDEVSLYTQNGPTWLVRVLQPMATGENVAVRADERVAA